jgi:hypothetical protein
LPRGKKSEGPQQFGLDERQEKVVKIDSSKGGKLMAVSAVTESKSLERYIGEIRAVWAAATSRR